MSFWKQIPRPIIALSPMDGVTDAPFRLITAKHGRPDIHFTEFTNVEGLARGAMLMLDDFLYSELERPVIAQIYGSEPESFYKIAIVVCTLGFDGVDINMGCPAKKVAARGCGAGLIRTPELAKTIVRAVQQGVRDWSEGKNVDELGFKKKMLTRIAEMNASHPPAERKPIPVSVKTRLGYNSVIVEEWVKHLLETEPAAISLHGRTLKQMYQGSADWEAIARAAEIIHQTDTVVLGNGDLNSPQDVVDKIRLSGVDGVLIGRGAMGNPWIFNHKDEIAQALQDPARRLDLPVVDHERLFSVVGEHSRCFEEIKGRERFAAMRKHFASYCRGFRGAAELRNRMCLTKSSEEVAAILAEHEGFRA